MINMQQQQQQSYCSALMLNNMAISFLQRGLVDEAVRTINAALCAFHIARQPQTDDEEAPPRQQQGSSAAFDDCAAVARWTKRAVSRLCLQYKYSRGGVGAGSGGGGGGVWNQQQQRRQKEQEDISSAWTIHPVDASSPDFFTLYQATTTARNSNNNTYYPVVFSESTSSSNDCRPHHRYRSEMATIIYNQGIIQYIAVLSSSSSLQKQREQGSQSHYRNNNNSSKMLDQAKMNFVMATRAWAKDRIHNDHKDGNDGGGCCCLNDVIRSVLLEALALSYLHKIGLDAVAIDEKVLETVVNPKIAEYHQYQLLGPNTAAAAA